MSVAFCIFNDHILRWVQRLLPIEPHDLWDGTANVDNMKAEAGASTGIVLLLQGEAGVELRWSLKAQFAAGLYLSCLIDGPAGVQTLIFLLVCQDAEGVIAAI